MNEDKSMVTIPYSVLDEAQDWKNGKVYRVKMVLKQTGSSENSADFEILDASSMNGSPAKSHDYFTDTGYVKSSNGRNN